jgi:hypothetical protein
MLNLPWRNKLKMLKKVHLLLILLSAGVFSQETGLFKNPPPGLNVPAILSADESTARTASLGTLEAKWVQSFSETAEKLYNSFSSGNESAINQIIKSILVNANIPETKINKLKIKFTGGAVEELGIDKYDVLFKDDFADKYKEEKLMMLTKIYRTSNVKIEVTEEGAAELDPAVYNALSEGIRFGNKTESTVQNTMITELPHLIFGYERSNITINRIADQKESIVIGVQTDVNINSINSLKSLEGRPGDFFMKIGSKELPQLLEFNITTENRSHSFRINNREIYTISFTEKSGNQLTVSLTGFMVSFD